MRVTVNHLLCVAFSMFGLEIWRCKRSLQLDSMLKTAGVNKSCSPLVPNIPCSAFAHTALTTSSRLQRTDTSRRRFETAGDTSRRRRRPSFQCMSSADGFPNNNHRLLTIDVTYLSIESSIESDPLRPGKTCKAMDVVKPRSAKIRQDPAEQQPSSVSCGMMVTVTPSVEAKPSAGRVGWCDRLS